MKTNELLASMSLEEKIGQMCVPIVQSSIITQDIEDYIKKYHVGMIRYCPNAEFDGNSEIVGEPNKYLTPSETAEFINSMQAMSKIAMFVAVDQEGSIRNDVNRNGAFAYSGHMSFGIADDTKLTYNIAYATGKEFKAMGINFVQAPIIDVMTYSGRKTIKTASFGNDVQKVSAHALAMMKGFQDAGIASMAKHFPGYGSVETDAHKGLSEIKKTFEELERTDLEPLKLLIQNGLNGVMTGHVLTHCMDNEYPATMSEKMIRGYLRKVLKYEGLVETDAIRMPAIRDRYGTKTAVVKAVNAGCDLVLLRGNYEHFTEGYFALLNAVKTGEIDIETVNQAVYRILNQKGKIGILTDQFVNTVNAGIVVGCKEHKRLALKLAEKSVTVFKNAIFPMKDDTSILVVCVEPQKIYAAQDNIQSIDMLYKSVEEVFVNCDKEIIKLQPTEEQIKYIKTRLCNYDVVIIGTCNAILYESQAKLVNDIVMEKKEKAIVVAMDSPYDIETVPEVQNYICTYGVAAASTKVVGMILSGKEKNYRCMPYENGESLC